MKNITFSLFFKFNYLLSSLILSLFLLFNQDYTLFSFILLLFATLSTTLLFYLLLYLMLFPFQRLKRWGLALATLVFISLDLILIIDFFIFRLYGFHINAMVLNIITSSDALDSIQLGLMPILFFISLICILIAIELYLLYKLRHLSLSQKQQLNQKINHKAILPLFFIVLSEKLIYGTSSLLNQNTILSKFEVIPLYQPLTFNRLASKLFHYKPDVTPKTTLKKNAKLHYPLEPIVIKKDPYPFPIFIIASDAVRNTILNKKTAPNIEAFKKDSLLFMHHRSGGNATRFGIFSFIYGLHAGYWFSFLNAAQPPILFQVLKKLHYQIDIISSTNTNWPEFRKTCYIDVLPHIKDDFNGKPWQKDREATHYLLDKIEHYKPNQPIFSFIFFDAPHGYSFPPEENLFHANQEINYLTVSKKGNDIASALSGYKNAIHYDDKLFGQIIEKLKQKGLYDKSMIIFTSDHGQEFYEYGHFGHNNAFDKAQTNSPLIIKPPKGMKLSSPQEASSTLTSHLDVIPSILHLIGVENPLERYSNGKYLFNKNYQREFAFIGNWNNSAIITPKYTYVFSNLPNKIFKNAIYQTESYQKVKNISVPTPLLLDVIHENTKFFQH